MNRYHLKIVSIASLILETVVEADLVGWSEAGLYEFVKTNNGKREVIAYYPVDKTIIEKIEYNIQ